MSNVMHTLKTEMNTDKQEESGADDIFIKEETSVGSVKNEELEYKKPTVFRNKIEESSMHADRLMDKTFWSAALHNCLTVGRDMLINASEKPVPSGINENIFLKKSISIMNKDEKNCLNFTLCKNPILQIDLPKNLKEHEELQISCYICHKLFTTKTQLIKHLCEHTGNKPYFCEICQSSFSQKATLIVHMRTHTGEKPFSCNICQLAFTKKSYVSVHMRTHMKEKPFSCNICQKSFSLKPNLSTHMRTHTGEKPYSCDICQKSFSLKRNLFTHTRTHTGEKPFSCDICQKSFSLKRNLSTHVRTHTGEKPFACNVCQQSFSVKSCLTRHMRIHTGKKL